MGYTHYWTFKKTHGKTQKLEELYQKAIKDCNKIIKAYYKENKGTEKSLSGYSAHSKVYGGLNVNGARGNDCEDFTMREHFTQNFENSDNFNFCKTRRYFYDEVVTACLSVMKFYLGDNITVESDGDYDDFKDGVNLANKVLRRTKNKVLNPIEFIPEQDLKIV